MAKTMRRNAIHTAKEAFFLASRRGYKVPGFFLVECEDGSSHWCLTKAVLNKQTGLIEQWVVEIKANGALQSAYLAGKCYQPKG